MLNADVTASVVQAGQGSLQKHARDVVTTSTISFTCWWYRFRPIETSLGSPLLMFCQTEGCATCPPLNGSRNVVMEIMNFIFYTKLAHFLSQVDPNYLNFWLLIWLC